MVASDRESLRGWREFHRATLAWKCDGLDDDDLRRRSTRAEAFGAWDCDATLRTVLLHLIHDYARHNGHADLLREGIDGVVGA
ncbi:MAG: DUF664 domain-containing protein [Acidimicrobiia bacterium]|nr:DUF664 domain-containing protein [Acidimicrobiia bacterium]